ncbi:uncharacterized protein LOC135462767 [Liolophura sinensis]|uniref:uncharacterized protein LOC135462767 n=1 Tax=Liolophura sinensis TaxID=3198878 RepID=UPI0031580060
MESVNNYDYLVEDFLDLSSILNLVNCEDNCSEQSGSVSSPYPSPTPSHSSSRRSSTETCPWISLQDEFLQLLFKDISSPLNALDHIRITERDDFFTNGVEREMDEFDLYQVRLRSSPQLYSRSVVSDTQGQPSKDVPMRNTVCVFCKNNGETLSVYGSHLLKDSSGRVTCPVLRRYTCPICGTSGDTAHTVRYCPLNSKFL